PDRRPLGRRRALRPLRRPAHLPPAARAGRRGRPAVGGRDPCRGPLRHGAHEGRGRAGRRRHHRRPAQRQGRRPRRPARRHRPHRRQPRPRGGRPPAAAPPLTATGGRLQPLATATRPLRVAVVGAGPAGLYAAEALLNKADLTLTVDVFDRFPTPFGLVRDGVAPDHQSIKAVTRVLDRTLADPRVRLFGNVAFGVDLHHRDLKRHYAQIVYAAGAPAHPATTLPRR